MEFRTISKSSGTQQKPSKLNLTLQRSKKKKIQKAVL